MVEEVEDVQVAVVQNRVEENTVQVLEDYSNDHKYYSVLQNFPEHWRAKHLVNLLPEVGLADIANANNRQNESILLVFNEAQNLDVEERVNQEDWYFGQLVISLQAAHHLSD